MKKETKQILIGLGVVVAAIFIYNRFIKKDDEFIIEGEIDSPEKPAPTEPVKQ